MEERNSFVFYASFQEAAEMMPTVEAKAAFYEAIILYGLKGIEPNFDEFTALEQQFLKLGMANIRPNIDAAYRRRVASIANGKKGGAPKGNQNARKQPKTSQKQPKNNLDVDVDVDVDAESITTSASTKTDNYGNNNPPTAGGGYPAPAQAINKPLEELTKEERAALLPTLI